MRGLATSGEVASSSMRERGMTFERLVRQGMIDQILANDRFWMKCPDVLVRAALKIEHADPDPKCHRRGSQHLGIRLDQSDAARIAGLYSHESNKARTDALRRRLQEAGVDLESAANAQISRPDDLLALEPSRRGDARSWAHARRPTATEDTRASVRQRVDGKATLPMPVSPGNPACHFANRHAPKWTIIDAGRATFVI